MPEQTKTQESTAALARAAYDAVLVPATAAREASLKAMLGRLTLSKAPAAAAYDAEAALARAAYDAAMARAKATFEEVMKPAQAACDAAIQPIWDAYDAIVQPARDAFVWALRRD